MQPAALLRLIDRSMLQARRNSAAGRVSTEKMQDNLLDDEYLHMLMEYNEGFVNEIARLALVRLLLVDTTGRGSQELTQIIWQATASYTSHFNTTGQTKSRALLTSNFSLR